MEPKVNLRGMINLDQIEDLLSEVLMRMDAQDKNLQSMNETLKTLMPRQSAERCIDELHDAVKVLSGRVDAVREASMARVDNKIIASGELSAQNKLKLDKVFMSLSDANQKIRLLETEVKASLNNHEKSLEDIKGDYTPIGMSRALQTGLKESGSRIDICEVALTKKVDKSNLGHIESLVVDLEKYSRHRKSAEERISKLESQTTDLILGLNEQSRLLQENSDRDELFANETNARHIASSKELQYMQSMLQKHERAIAEDCVQKDSFGDLLNWSENTNELLQQFKKRYSDLERDLEQISSAVESKADNEEMTKYYVRREKLYSIIEAMGKDIENRAKITELHGTRTSLKSLQEFVNQQHTQLQIAIRFVEWFTQRGDTYECNMQVIDKHLKQLASSSVGCTPGSHDPTVSGRLPYSSQNFHTFKHHEKVKYFSVHPPTMSFGQNSGGFNDALETKLDKPS